MHKNCKVYDLSKEYKNIGFGEVRDDNFAAYFLPLTQCLEVNFQKLADKGVLYLFRVEPNFQRKSKRREYLGTFGKRLIKLEDNYLDYEISRSDDLSVYAGLRQLKTVLFSGGELLHGDFTRNFYIISNSRPSEILKNSEYFLSMKRLYNYIQYENVLNYLGDKILLKYWHDEGKNAGFVVVGKHGSNCEGIVDLLLKCD